MSVAQNIGLTITASTDYKSAASGLSPLSKGLSESDFWGKAKKILFRRQIGFYFLKQFVWD